MGWGCRVDRGQRLGGHHEWKLDSHSWGQREDTQRQRVPEESQGGEEMKQKEGRGKRQREHQAGRRWSERRETSQQDFAKEEEWEEDIGGGWGDVATISWRQCHRPLAPFHSPWPPHLVPVWGWDKGSWIQAPGLSGKTSLPSSHPPWAGMDACAAF